MARYPGAVWKEVPRFRTLMIAIRVNLHTAVTSSTSLFGYFRQLGNVCSHFYVREDGTVEQYVDTRYMAAADLQGNRDTISIETWDGYKRLWDKNGDLPLWTPAQVVSLARLLAWISVTHNIPLTRLENSLPGRKGIGWHRQGIKPWKVAGGLTYSNSYGKVCPGDRRIAQVPQILDLARTIVAGGTIPRGGGGTTSRGGTTRGYAMTYVREVQSLLNDLTGADLLEDGVLGPVTVQAVKAYQAKHGLVVDGDPGSITMRHLRAAATSPRHSEAYVKDVQALLNKVNGAGLLVDGVLGPVTVAAVRAYQAKHGLVADGDPGPITVAHLRARANPPKPAAPSIFPLRVDGLWGTVTTKALQTRLSVPVTGHLNRATVVALQRVLGVRQDGDYGPVTKKALQRWLGVPADAWVGPKTVKALQSRLNRGPLR